MPMWISFWHLMWRSLVDFPALLSGNWLGTIVLPLLLFVLFEAQPLRRGWSVMTPQAKREFWRNSGVLVGLYLLLFVWVVMKDTYQDHVNNYASISTLQQQLKDSQKSGLQLHLDEYGFAKNISQNGASLITQPGCVAEMIASIRNLGPASIADNWELSITVPGRSTSMQGVPIYVRHVTPKETSGFNLGKGTIPYNKLLYRETLNPIATGDERQGIMTFFIKGVSRDEAVQKGTTMTLSCHDVYGHSVSATAVLQGVYTGHRFQPGLE